MISSKESFSFRDHPVPRACGGWLAPLPLFNDERGDLSVCELADLVPFIPRRFFITFNVPAAEVRGEHAHRECQQFLFSVAGSCSVMLDDGETRVEHQLHRMSGGLYLPPMVWAAEYNHSSDSALLVFASHSYDPNDYIRDYDEFLSAKRLVASEKYCGNQPVNAASL